MKDGFALRYVAPRCHTKHGDLESEKPVFYKTNF